MFLDGLDELDQKIVRLLIQNARMSYSDIGKEVGISRVAVKTRIQSLEKRGVIEEYTTIINPQKINGAVVPKLHGVQQDEKLLQRPFHEHGFTKQEQGNLQGTGNLGWPRLRNSSGGNTP